MEARGFDLSATKVYGWAGAIFGLIGTIILSLNITSPLITFVFYAVSNVMWIAYAISKRETSLLIMNGGYIMISIIGLYNYTP